MWFTSKKTEKAKHDEMLKMARIYADSNSIDEFLVAVDLQNFKHISSSKWRNPFVIYHTLKNSRALRICNNVGLLIVVAVCGLLSWHDIMSGTIIIAAITALQLLALLAQISIISKELDAKHALNELEMLGIDALVGNWCVATCGLRNWLYNQSNGNASV